jgi:two-component system chemotaxis response regulator CheB
MPAARILIVDDSALTRRVLTEALSPDPSIAIVGTAGDGETALRKFDELNPDLVTLDVELPRMSGLEILREIRRRSKKIPVIMFSSLTERGALTTLEALSLGASDYASKPGSAGSLEETKQKIREELLPKIRALCGLKSESANKSKVVEAIAANTHRTARPGARKIELVAIGCSTGGPNALGELLPRISSRLSAPIVIVQHMPPVFTRYLAERLAKACKLRIGEGSPAQMIRPGEVWIAPGDYHMTVKKNANQIELEMNQGPPENSCRPAVDVLFRSVSEVFGPNALAVVLTGMGSDGQKGAERIVARGGKVIVQDQASSVVWGMPGQVAEAGYAEAILPLEMIAGEIEARVGLNSGFAGTIALGTEANAN